LTGPRDVNELELRCVHCGGVDDEKGNLLIRVACLSNGERDWIHAKCWTSWREAQEAELDARADLGRATAPEEADGAEAEETPASFEAAPVRAWKDDFCHCGAAGEAFGVFATDAATMEAAHTRYPETRRWYCRAHQPDVDYLKVEKHAPARVRR
jgi:hypothetical protein